MFNGGMCCPPFPPPQPPPPPFIAPLMVEIFGVAPIPTLVDIKLLAATIPADVADGSIPPLRLTPTPAASGPPPLQVVGGGQEEEIGVDVTGGEGFVRPALADTTAATAAAIAAVLASWDMPSEDKKDIREDALTLYSIMSISTVSYAILLLRKYGMSLGGKG